MMIVLMIVTRFVRKEETLPLVEDVSFMGGIIITIIGTIIWCCKRDLMRYALFLVMAKQFAVFL